jgi:predicted flavoprotein YhiN
MTGFCSPIAGLREARGQGGRIAISTALGRWLPARLADAVATDCGLQGARLADQGNAVLDRVGARVNRWSLRPVGSEGWRTAEVTLGGIDTRELDSRSMAARSVPGLYFIGEVVDVTGWLGGYNFQWAWASAQAAARAIAAGN